MNVIDRVLHRYPSSESLLASGERYREVTLDGRPHVYSVYGQYYMDREDFWDARFAEGRHPFANHDFELGQAVREDGIPEQWGRVRAVCHRCGEKRRVYHGVEMRDLNSMWCKP